VIRWLRNMFRYLRSTISIKSRLVLIGLVWPLSRCRLHPSNRQPMPLTSHAAYAASRISSNLKGSTKEFGRLQAPQPRRPPQWILSRALTHRLRGRFNRCQQFDKCQDFLRHVSTLIPRRIFSSSLKSAIYRRSLITSLWPVGCLDLVCCRKTRAADFCHS
jgi:hypothetical protein